MAKSTRVITKERRKRAPAAGHLIGVRVQPDLEKLLDNWRRKQSDLPSQPEAIRRLVEIGLKAKAR